GIGEVEYRNAALIPALHHDVAAGDGNQVAVVRDAVFDRRLRRRQLVVTLERQGALGVDGEDRVRAPFRLVGCSAAWCHAAAPLVGENHFACVVVERRRVPVGEVRVRCGRDAYRVYGILDVEQQAVPGARTTGYADCGINRDVVALIGAEAHAARAHRGQEVRIHVPLDTGPELRAVGSDGRVRARVTLHDDVEHLVHECSGRRRRG